MKNKIFSMGVAIAIILGCTAVGTCALADDLSIETLKPVDVSYSITEAYQYPICPGTDEWFAIESNAERVARCQIPEEILAEMTTDALIETVLDYPFLIDLLLFSSNEEGFEAVRDSFNGLQELVNRPDGIDKLYQYSNALKSTYSLNALTEYEIEIILQGVAKEEENVSVDNELARQRDGSFVFGLSITNALPHYAAEVESFHT